MSKAIAIGVERSGHYRHDLDVPRFDLTIHYSDGGLWKHLGIDWSVVLYYSDDVAPHGPEIPADWVPDVGHIGVNYWMKDKWTVVSGAKSITGYADSYEEAEQMLATYRRQVADYVRGVEV